MVFNPQDSLRRIAQPPELSIGDSQWAVKLLRRLLAQQGIAPGSWLDPDCEVSAEFDADLQLLLRAFQLREGLPASGRMDMACWRAMAGAAKGSGQHFDSSRDRISARIVEVAMAAAARSIREHGANRGTTVEMIQRHAGTAAAVPWCVAFAWAVVDLAYLLEQKLPPRLGKAQKLSSSALVHWAGSTPLPGEDGGGVGRKRVITDPADARPGDLLVLRGGSTGYFHTAVTIALPNDGFVATVEGNTNRAGSSEGDGIHARQRRVGSEHCVFVRL